MKFFLNFLNGLFWLAVFVAMFYVPFTAVPNDLFNSVWNSGNHIQFYCLMAMVWFFLFVSFILISTGAFYVAERINQLCQ